MHALSAYWRQHFVATTANDGEGELSADPTDAEVGFRFLSNAGAAATIAASTDS
jgi:hypothetical protein